VEEGLQLPGQAVGLFRRKPDAHEGLGQDAFGEGHSGLAAFLLYKELPGEGLALEVAPFGRLALEPFQLLGHQGLEAAGGDGPDPLFPEAALHLLGQLVGLLQGKPGLLQAPGQEALGEGAPLFALRYLDLLKGEGLAGQAIGHLLAQGSRHLFQKDLAEGLGRDLRAPLGLEALLHGVGHGLGGLEGDAQRQKGLHQKPFGEGPAAPPKAHEDLAHPWAS